MTTPYRQDTRPGHVLFIAAVFTIAIFAGLPLIDSLHLRDHDRQKLYELTRVDLPPPPPPPRARKKEVVEPNAPRPTLAQPRSLIPLEAVLTLNVAVGDVGGDFDVNFGVSTPDLLDAGNYIFEIEEIDQAPHPLASIKPLYPPGARMRKIEGDVQVEFVVDSDGTVRDAEVTSSTPQGVFDNAALRAVRHWKFTPGKKHGQAVPVRVRQPIKFTLKE
jgi:protein TonB